ncbi:hypothetical protein WLQ65_16290 [Pseudoalteromonas piscicida]|uniref:hypothetical protein n=1 Tax=Pseudoalteromonas piscicida TaxID=43662 RepID=UPI0030C912B4
MLNINLYVLSSDEGTPPVAVKLACIPREGEYIRVNNLYYKVKSVIYTSEEDVDVELIVAEASNKNPALKRAKPKPSKKKLGFG